MEDKKRYPTQLVVENMLTAEDIIAIKKFCLENNEMALQQFVTEAVAKYAIDLGVIEGKLVEEE